MSSPAHEQYRKQLIALATDAHVIGAMEDAAGQCAWWPRGRKWRRTYGRFNPERDAYSSLVFETDGKPQLLFNVEVSELHPVARNDHDLIINDETLGWLHVMPFPSDGALDTLSSVLAEHGCSTIVRYRPQRRCTIRFDENGGTHFVKVYPKKFLRHGRGEQLHSENVALWEASSRGELEFAVARPERWEAQTRTLWQAQLDGTPAVTRLYGSEGAGLAYRMGRAAASLTRSGVEPHRIFDGAAQLSASVRYGKELGQHIPILAVIVNSLLETLDGIHAAAGERALRPIHGDMDTHQWLADGGRLGLVDFDDLASGDPELDVATFLAELEFEDDRPPLPFEPLAAAFLDGYELTAGSLDRRLLQAYLAHKRLFKALRSARALRPDGDGRAERHLAQACQCIARGSFELLARDGALA